MHGLPEPGRRQGETAASYRLVARHPGGAWQYNAGCTNAAVVIVVEGVRGVQPNCDIESVIFFPRPVRSRRLPLLARAALLALVAFVTGCNAPTSVAPPPKPFAGVTVRVAVEGEPVARSLIERHGHRWADGSGAKLQ